MIENCRSSGLPAGRRPEVRLMHPSDPGCCTRARAASGRSAPLPTRRETRGMERGRAETMGGEKKNF